MNIYSFELFLTVMLGNIGDTGGGGGGGEGGSGDVKEWGKQISFVTVIVYRKAALLFNSLVNGKWSMYIANCLTSRK